MKKIFFLNLHNRSAKFIWFDISFTQSLDFLFFFIQIWTNFLFPIEESSDKHSSPHQMYGSYSFYTELEKLLIYTLCTSVPGKSYRSRNGQRHGQVDGVITDINSLLIILMRSSGFNGKVAASAFFLHFGSGEKERENEIRSLLFVSYWVGVEVIFHYRRGVLDLWRDSSVWSLEKREI